MKKTILSQFAIAILAVVLLASCGGLKNMAKQIADVKFEVKPNPLEMHNGKVAVAIDATFPAEYFSPKAVVEITPYIAYGEQVYELKSITLQGEKVTNNFEVIKEAGGSVSYTDEFDFSDEMRVCELKLKIKAWQGGKEDKAIIVPHDKVLATGIITTSELVKQAMEEDVLEASSDLFKGTALADVQLPAKTIVPYNATIRYKIQRSDISRKDTKEGELSTLVENVQKATGENLTYLGTEISSYASPDGPTELNEKLVGKRGTTAEEFINKELSKVKVEGAIKKGTTSAEDWDGFRAELQKSNIQDKDIILRVLSMHSDAATREREIKNIAEAYEELKTQILPLLRRSEIKINFESDQRSDSEIVGMAKTTPAQLTEVELLHGATVPADLNERKAIYTNFVSTYPNDWRGPNNLGVVLVGLNDNAGATAEFEKANKLSNGNGIVQNNLGVMAAIEGDYAKAAAYLKNATVSDPKIQSLVDYNLGSVASASGNYDDGLSKLSGSNTMNEAITKLVKGDTAGARTAIDAAKADTGLKFYIKAIIEARDAKTDLAIENLKTAISKDASLKARAKTDMEFQAIRTEQAFLDAVK